MIARILISEEALVPAKSLKVISGSLIAPRSSALSPIYFLTTSDGNKYILAYKRSSGSSEVVVVLNTSTSEQTVNIPGINGDYSLWLNSNTIANGVSRKGYSFGGSLNINVPAKGYLVFVKGAYTDETINTRIDPIIADQESISANDCYYNLQGMVISKPQEGIFIYKGRKYIMH